MQTIVVVFDDLARAQDAQSALLSSGFPGASVRLSYDAATTAGGSSIGNFFRNLFGADDDGDSRLYADAAARGYHVLAVDVGSEDELMRAVSLIEQYGPIDFDARAAQWGNTYTQDMSRSAAGAQPVAQQHAQMQSAPQDARMQGASYSGAQQGQQVIPVVQEELSVGKREVDRGRFRIVQRVVEQPVSEAVRLREDQVRIERHPVDRLAAPGEIPGLLREGTLEVRATAEEPVVQKAVRIVEEVVVGKQTTEREQRISDTVRRTEVDVTRLDGAAQDEYAPAYAYGSSAADQYRGRRWEEVEPALRTDWEQRNAGSAWDRVKNAVREGWNRVTR